MWNLPVSTLLLVIGLPLVIIFLLLLWAVKFK